MDDPLLTQVLSLMERLEKENSDLRKKVEELSKKQEVPIALSSLREAPVSLMDYVVAQTQREHALSSSKEQILQSKIRKTVDSILEYSKVTGFQ